MTPLDAAHSAMLAQPEDDLARLRYYRLLADAELYLLLDDEPDTTGNLAPRVFPLEQGPVVLAFDTEERLAEFAGVAVPYAALPGRVIVGQLAGQQTGLGVNLNDPVSAWLMAPYAIDWLSELLETKPEESRGRPVMVMAPEALDPALSEALAVAISGAGGMALGAGLVQAAWGDGTEALLLTYIGARDTAEAPLSRALAEALAFSGLESGSVDVVFLPPDDAFVAHIMAVGQPLQLPELPPEPPKPAPPSAPGMDPTKPPRLR